MPNKNEDSSEDSEMQDKGAFYNNRKVFESQREGSLKTRYVMIFLFPFLFWRMGY